MPYPLWTLPRIVCQELILHVVLPSRRLFARDGGQALVLVAASLTVLIAFLGLAIDGGMLRYQKRRLQNAADAAALAASLEAVSCGSTANCSAMRTAAQTALVENGFTGSSLLSNCAAGTGSGLELSVNNPPCALSGDPNRSNNDDVEVIVSKPVSTFFVKVLGINSVALKARAEASQSVSNCIYALDPSGSGAVTADSTTQITATCGLLVESNSSTAGTCYNASIVATSLLVVGGVSGYCTSSTYPVVGARLPSPANPLASLAKPSVPACGSSTASPYLGSNAALVITGTAVLYPTYAYCGGITIRNGARVTFQPGVYVLGSSSTAGGLSMDVGATVTGSNVTFYNYGSSGAVTFSYSSYTSGGVSLVAPTTGIYAGILFFQDERNTAQATLIGATKWNTVLQGTYYFPTAKVVYTYSGPAAYNILVAYDIEIAAQSSGSLTQSNFLSNYSSLPGGSPIKQGTAVLVE